MERRRFVSTAACAAFCAASGVPAREASGAMSYAGTGARLHNHAPVRDGFAMPAEWARHERTLMQFLPPQNWYAHELPGARREWAAVANAVAEFEPVTMAVQRSDRAAAERLLSSAIELVEFPMNDGWCRDSGPVILVNEAGERAVAGFEFNGWGGKFPPYDDDALLKARLAAHLDIPLYPAPLVAEGGAIAVDGAGTCITTEECLLHSNRNPGKSKVEVEQVLKDWLGVETVIWLGRGLTPDPITDGHVDGIAAFIGPGRVMLHTTDDDSDPNHAITLDAKRRLEATPDARGRRLEIIELPLADDVVHLNFYICNGGVVVPTVGDPRQDDAPLAILRDAFPDHAVVPVAGQMLSYGGGGVHCITQQVPAV